MSEKIDILSLLPAELEALLAECGEKKFRAKQVFEWLHKKKVRSFAEMTNLSKATRALLEEKCVITASKIVDLQISLKDNTQKYLFDFANNTIIESVLMDYEYGKTLCVSCQVGCKMGCAFCASGMNGFIRNLTAGEILSQVYEIERSSAIVVSRIVMMGIGEPFDNYENVQRFLALLHAKDGHDTGMRNITISTCGLVPQILDLARSGLQVNLAISLHAPNDEIRRQIMPIAKQYPMDVLLDACRIYTRTTRRRITFEYALIDGVNDWPEHAQELAGRMKNMLAHVNLIPINEVAELGFKSSKNAKAFMAKLQAAGINATMRRKLGEDIDGACGQLRNRYTAK